MLKRTFVHLPGVGAATERNLWARGFHSWDDFCDPSKLPFSKKRADELTSCLIESARHLDEKNPAHFAGRLNSNMFWRFFPEFRNCLAYLDIETTGLGAYSDHITTAAVYDGKSIATYVHGKNLEELPEALRAYKVLVTYNGSCFDIPFVEKFFGVTLDHVHIDLRYLLGVDGYFAVLLWDEYRKTGDPGAIETLLSYNVADTVNLETLAVMAYNRKLAQTPFHEICALPLPCPPVNPFSPDARLIREIRSRYYFV